MLYVFFQSMFFFFKLNKWAKPSNRLKPEYNKKRFKAQETTD